MKQLITIALGVALGIAGYVLVNRYLYTHGATVVVQGGMKEHQMKQQMNEQQLKQLEKEQ